MSYDLMVFESASAPRTRDEFVGWFHRQAEWTEPHGYNDPKQTSPRLRGWYESITREFPDLNGPDVTDADLGNSRLTDYSIGNHVIYAAFAWSVAEDAYEAVRRLAVEHDVGFYDVSGDEGDGEVYFPGDRLRTPSQGQWRRIAAEFHALRNQEEQ